LESNELSSGNGLKFTINSDEDLKKMVINLLYYMVKYDCIAAVKEYTYNNQDPENLIQKYALIASPNRLLTNKYIRSAYDANEYKKKSNLELPYFEMSEFANMRISPEDKSNYELLAEILKGSQEKLSKYSIYLLSNTEILREYLDLTYGGGTKTIKDFQVVNVKKPSF